MPAGVAGDDLLADVGDGTEADAEDDDVEVVADAGGPRSDPPPVPVRLEAAALAREPLAIDELRPVGRRWPAREPADVGQRPVRAVAQLGLHVEVERLDVGRLAAAETHVLEPVEELEAHAPAREDLVEGCEHDVAHAGLHAPEEGAAVGEEGARHAAERLTRGDARPRRVAVLVGEAEVVEPAKVARVERRVGRAVHPQPFATVVVVDRVEAARVGEEMVPDDAAQRGERQVGDRPQAAEREVALGARLDLAPGVGGEGVQEAEHEVLRVAGERPDHRLEERDPLDQRGQRRDLAVAEEAADAREDRVRSEAVAGAAERPSAGSSEPSSVRRRAPMRAT